MWKIVAVLALTALAIITGHFANQHAVSTSIEATAAPQLMYAGIRG